MVGSLLGFSTCLYLSKQCCIQFYKSIPNKAASLKKLPLNYGFNYFKPRSERVGKSCLSTHKNKRTLVHLNLLFQAECLATTKLPSRPSTKMNICFSVPRQKLVQQRVNNRDLENISCSLKLMMPVFLFHFHQQYFAVLISFSSVPIKW